MRLRSVGLAALLALATAVAVLPGPSARAAPGRPAPYFPDAPDPHVIRVQGTYYAYSTNKAAPWGGLIHLPVVTSTDLATWSGPTEAFPNLPAWVTPGKTWAPTVTRDRDGYTLFYTATERRTGRQCVGRARSSSPTGPFVDRRRRPIVCQRALGGSIDAYVFRDRNGARYLYWKNDGNCCGYRVSLWGQRLDRDEFPVGRARRLLSYDRIWERPLIENPAMTRSPDRGGAYRLFYSGNWYESKRYATGFARCTGPLGPCTKVTTTQPWHRTTDHAFGPGGASFFTDTLGRNWMALHGWSRPPDRVGYGNGGRRSLYIEKVDFSTDRPRLNTSLPYSYHRGPPHPFVDVPPWADPAVSWAWAGELVAGYPDGPDRRFLPNRAVKRDDAVRWLRAADPPGPVSALTRGAQPLTRGQAARLLYRAAGSPDTSGPSYDHPPLTDVTPALVDAVRWMLRDPDGAGSASAVATAYGDATFRPTAVVTRAAFARMLHRLLTDA